MVSVAQRDARHWREMECIYCQYPSIPLIREELDQSTRASQSLGVLHSAVSLKTAASLLPSKLALNDLFDN